MKKALVVLLAVAIAVLAIACDGTLFGGKINEKLVGDWVGELDFKISYGGHTIEAQTQIDPLSIREDGKYTMSQTVTKWVIDGENNISAIPSEYRTTDYEGKFYTLGSGDTSGKLNMTMTTELPEELEDFKKIMYAMSIFNFEYQSGNLIIKPFWTGIAELVSGIVPDSTFELNEAGAVLTKQP